MRIVRSEGYLSIFWLSVAGLTAALWASETQIYLYSRQWQVTLMKGHDTKPCLVADTVPQALS